MEKTDPIQNGDVAQGRLPPTDHGKYDDARGVSPRGRGSKPEARCRRARRRAARGWRSGDLRLGAVAFAAGALSVHALPRLPDFGWGWWWPMLSAFALALVLARRFAWLRLPLWALAGFGYTLWSVQGLLAGGLAQELEGKDLQARGTVASIPRGDRRRVGFLFDLEAVQLEGRPQAFSGRVKLSWYNNAPRLRVGRRLEPTIRLKRPHGFLNPGGFDYEGWLFRSRVRAVGYVRSGEGQDAPLQAGLDTSPRYAVGRLRQRIGAAISAALPDSPYQGLIKALAIGNRDDIDNDQWEVLRHTGTAHLLAISGLHIGLVAGLVLMAVRWLWGWSSRAALRLPAPIPAAAAGALGAATYALLAGFSLSTRRALIMVLAVLAVLLLRRRTTASRIMALAALAVLLHDPLAVASPGFWLSFGAVAVLLYAMGGRPLARGWWWRWGRAQWPIAVGLLPVGLYLFQRGAWLAPAANLVAVPWVSLTVVPPVLLGSLLLPVAPGLGKTVLAAAEYSLAELWPLLETLARLPAADWTAPAPPFWALVCGLIGAAWVLAPRGLPRRWLGVVGMLPLVLLPHPQPTAGSAWFTLLDIGHGLATVIRTQHHTLVYDTGPRLGPRLDAGRAAVVPFLRHEGIRRLDKLIISHGDNDHIGGARSVLRALAVDEVLTSVPERFAAARRCRAGQQWTWDGVRFRILHPRPETRFEGNNASCVLRVESSGGSLLIGADIERDAERRLLKDAAGQLRADVLVAPHQGSRTSSTAEFVAAVQPRYVLFPVAYRNRYKHPHPQVVARYRAIGAQRYSSAEHGALCFVLPSRPPVGAPRSRRYSAPRWWHGFPAERSGGILAEPQCW